jgi:hypothetical protein
MTALPGELRQRKADYRGLSATGGNDPPLKSAAAIVRLATLRQKESCVSAQRVERKLAAIFAADIAGDWLLPSHRDGQIIAGPAQDSYFIISI